MAVVDGEDRISALPDAMILHLFSFLEIKDVVKTGTLSRRWYSLWTQTSAVTINVGSNRDVTRVERFFLLCTSPVICKLHLCLQYYVNYNFDHWIRFAVGRGIEHLCLDLPYKCWDGYYVLPTALFRCKSLKWLKLKSCEIPWFKLRTLNGVFMGISWNSLKVLCLHDMKALDCLIEVVLEGSPLLESLTLENCHGMNNIRIFSKNMKELVIRRYFDPYYIDASCLQIYAPYLSSLRLLDRWVGKKVIVLKEVPSLVEVELNCRLTFDRTNIYGTMKEVLNKLRLVDKLVIGNEILKDLHNYKGNGDSSLQLNCRSLTIMTLADQYSPGRIARALEIAPNVEKLVIDFTPKTSSAGIPVNEDLFFDIEILRGRSWKSWIGCIKNIEITGFPSRNSAKPIYWLFLIKALLREAYVLEKMVINAKWSWTNPCEALEEQHAQDVLEVAEGILGYRRGSKAAEVILNYPSKRRQSVVRSS